MRLQNKVALVTGTGDGIGRGLALAFAREGADLALCDLNRETLGETERQVQAAGRKTFACSFDIREAGAIEAFVNQAAEQLGRIDCLVNNAAAALLMAPIAVRVAQGVDASPDPFLMSVAVGASCAFLTPIGHQSNALVMGPGGYKFSDYWRMGLPLSVLVVVVSIPVILQFFPL